MLLYLLWAQALQQILSFCGNNNLRARTGGGGGEGVTTVWSKFATPTLYLINNDKHIIFYEL
jgi:hypothetical protein